MKEFIKLKFDRFFIGEWNKTGSAYEGKYIFGYLAVK